MKKFLPLILTAIVCLTCFAFVGCNKEDTSISKHEPQGTYKIAFLGDSITDKGVYADIVTTHYTDYIRDNYAFVSGIQNVGLGGSCIAGLPNKDGVTLSFTQRYKNIDKNANVIVVLGGTNDYGYGSSALPNPLGEYGDDTVESFFGALKVLIDGFEENYPNSKVVFVTPLYRKEQESNGIPNKNKYGFTLSRYVEAIKETCEKRNVACFDAFNKITEIDAFTYTEYEVDGLHLNTEGNILLGKYIGDFLSEILE